MSNAFYHAYDDKTKEMYSKWYHSCCGKDSCGFLHLWNLVYGESVGTEELIYHKLITVYLIPASYHKQYAEYHDSTSRECHPQCWVDGYRYGDAGNEYQHQPHPPIDSWFINLSCHISERILLTILGWFFCIKVCIKVPQNYNKFVTSPNYICLGIWDFLIILLPLRLDRHFWAGYGKC